MNATVHTTHQGEMLRRVVDEAVGADAALQLASNLLRYETTGAAEIDFWCRLEDTKHQLALIYATLLREPVPGTPEEMDLFVQRHDRALNDPAVQVLLELLRTPRDPPQPWVPRHAPDVCRATVRGAAPTPEEGKMRNAMVWMLHPDARAAIPLVAVGPIAALDTCPMDVLTDWVNHSAGPLGRGLVVAAYWLDRTTRTSNETVPVVANEVEFDDITQYANAMAQLQRPVEEGMVLCNAARVSYRWPFAAEPQLPAPAALLELDKATAFAQARAAMEARSQKLADKMGALLLELNQMDSELLNTNAKAKSRTYTPKTHAAEMEELTEQTDALTEAMLELEERIKTQEAKVADTRRIADRPGSSLTAQKKAKTASNVLERLRAQLEAHRATLGRIGKRGQKVQAAKNDVEAYDKKLAGVIEALPKAYQEKKAQYDELKREFDTLDAELGEADAYAEYGVHDTLEVDEDEEEKTTPPAGGDADPSHVNAADATAPQIFAEAWSKAHRNWQVEQRSKGRFDVSRLRSFLAARGEMQNDRFMQVTAANTWHLNARVVFRCCVCERASWMFWTVPMADVLWYCGGPRCELLGAASASHTLLLDTLFEARVQTQLQAEDAEAMPEPTDQIPVSRRGQPFVSLPALDVEHRTALHGMAQLMELYTSDLRMDQTSLLQSALFGGKLDRPVDVARPSSLFAGWSITLSGAILPPEHSVALAPPLTAEMMTFLYNMQTVEEAHVITVEGTLAEAMSDVPACITAAVALPDAEMDEQRERKERIEVDTRLTELGAALATEAQPMDIEVKDSPDEGHAAPDAEGERAAKRGKPTVRGPVGCLVLPPEDGAPLPDTYWDARIVMQTVAVNAFRVRVTEAEAKGDNRYKSMVTPQEGEAWSSTLVNAVYRVLCSALNEEQAPFEALVEAVNTDSPHWTALLEDVHRARVDLLREAWDQWHDHVEQVAAQLRDATEALRVAQVAHGAEHKSQRIQELERRVAVATEAHNALRLDTGLGTVGAVSVALSLRISSDARLTWYEYAGEKRLLPLDESNEDYVLALSVHAYQRIAASRVVKQKLAQPLPPAAGFSPRRVLASWLDATGLKEPVDTEAKFNALLSNWTSTHQAASAFGTHATLQSLAEAEAERQSDTSGADPRLWIFALAGVPCFSVEHGRRVVQCARDALEEMQDISELPLTLPVQLDDDTQQWLRDELTAWRTALVTDPGLRLWATTRPFLPFAITEAVEPGQPPTVVDLSIFRHTGVRTVKAAVYMAHLGNWALHRLTQYSNAVKRIDQQTPLVEPYASLALFRLRGVMPLRRDVACMIVGAGLTVLVAQARNHTLPFQPLGTVPVISRVPTFPDAPSDARVTVFQERIQAAYRQRVPTADQDITVKRKREWNATLHDMMHAVLDHTHDPLALFAPFGVTQEQEALTLIDAGLYWLRQTSAWWSDPQWKLGERTQLALVSHLARTGDATLRDNALSSLMLHQDAVYTQQPQAVRTALLEKVYDKTKAWIKSGKDYEPHKSELLLEINTERIITQLLEARMLMIAETFSTNVHAIIEHFSLVSHRDPGLDVSALARAYAPAKLEPNFVNYLYALQYMFVSSNAAAKWATDQKVALAKVSDPVKAFLEHRWDQRQIRALLELTPETATELIRRFENKDPLLPRLMRYRRVDALPVVVQEATAEYMRELYRTTQAALTALQSIASRERVPVYLSHWYLSARHAQDAKAITNAVRWCMEDPTFDLVPTRLVRIVVRHYLTIEETQRMGMALIKAEDQDGDPEDSSGVDEDVEWDATNGLEEAKAQMRAPRRYKPIEKTKLAFDQVEEAAALSVIRGTGSLARAEYEQDLERADRAVRLRRLQKMRPKKKPKDEGLRVSKTHVSHFVQNQTVEHAWVAQSAGEVEQKIRPLPENATPEERAKWEKRKRLARQRALRQAAQRLEEVPTLTARAFDAESEDEYDNEVDYERDRTARAVRRADNMPVEDARDDLARRSPKGVETDSDVDPADETTEAQPIRRLGRGGDTEDVKADDEELPEWVHSEEVKRAELAAPKLLGMRALAAMSEADYATDGQSARATAYRMRRQTVDPLTLFELGRGINAEVPLEWTQWPPRELGPGSDTRPAMLKQIRERLDVLLPIYRKRAYNSLWSYGGVNAGTSVVPSVDLRPWVANPRQVAPRALAWGALRFLVQAAEDVLGPAIADPEEYDGAAAMDQSGGVTEVAGDAGAVDSSDDEVIPVSLRDETQKEAIYVRNMDRAAKRRLRAFQRVIDEDEALAADRMHLFLAEDDETVPQLALLNLPPVPIAPQNLRELLVQAIPKKLPPRYQARMLRLASAVLDLAKGKFVSTLRRASRTWLSWTRDEFGLRKTDLVQPFPSPDKGPVAIEIPEIREEVQRMQRILEADTLRREQMNKIANKADAERKAASKRWLRAVAVAKAGGATSTTILDPQDRANTVVDYLTGIFRPTLFLVRNHPRAATEAAKAWVTSARAQVAADVARGAAPSADLGPFDVRGTDLRVPETLASLSRSLNTTRRQSASRGLDVVTIAREVAELEQAAYDAEDRMYSEQYCKLLKKMFRGSAANVVAALARRVSDERDLNTLPITRRLEVWSQLDVVEANIRAQVMHVPRENAASEPKKLHYIGQDSATTTARQLQRFALSQLQFAAGAEEAIEVYTEAAGRALVGSVGLKSAQLTHLDNIRYSFDTPEKVHMRMVLRSAFAETMIDQLWPVLFPAAATHGARSFKRSLFRGIYMEKCMALMQHMLDTENESEEVTPVPKGLGKFTTHDVVREAFESYKLAVAQSKMQIAAGTVSNEALRMVTDMAVRSRVAQVVSRLSGRTHKAADKAPAKSKPLVKGKPVSGPSRLPPPPLHFEVPVTAVPAPRALTLPLPHERRPPNKQLSALMALMNEGIERMSLLRQQHLQ